MKATVTQIRKRDGSVASFDQDRITEAIFKAAQSVGGSDRTMARQISDKVVASMHQEYAHKIPSVEDVQDLVEKILIEESHAKTAKAFILYRQKRTEERDREESIPDCPEVKRLKTLQVAISKQAEHILNTSTGLDELGRAIFLDRYSVKTKRDEIGKGDLVIVITKEDAKYPKKDLGLIKDILQDETCVLHMITGNYASEENRFEFRQSLWKCDKPLESIDDAYKRVARAVASVEVTPELRDRYAQVFLEELREKHIQPAGRIMTGANVDQHGRYTSNLTLYNCYVIPSPKDSRDSIVRDTLFQMIEIMSRGGGVGISLATLRPRYAYVRGVHGKSSGSVSWGGLFSYATALIEQGGSRRGALMLMQADWHPDVLEFIESKTKMGRIENANISVMVSDHFMEALKRDDVWHLEYPDYEQPAIKTIYEQEWDGDLQKWKSKGYPTKVYKTVKARELWDKLIRSAWTSAEPGVVFMERYNKMSNSWYFNPVICTNPCGEQGLPGWGVCNLGHLYLASFIQKTGADKEGPLYEMDWDALARSSRRLARFLDNVIDLTPYHFPENEKNQKSERRVGGGTLGLGELLIRLRMKYGSDESLELINRIYKTIAVSMYLESSAIAAEKGAFPKFEAEKFLESGFMKGMPEDVREAVRQNGIRNVTLTTQAPTGTVGSMLGTSTGIEPYYAFEFYRQSRLGFHKVLIPMAQEYNQETGKLPSYFASAMDLAPVDHIKVQAVVQRWTDSSISKTANAPNDFGLLDTKRLYEMAYDLGCKGVTIYRDGCRNEQVLSTSADTEQKNAASAEGLSEVDLTKKATIMIAAAIAGNGSMSASEREYGSEIGMYCPQCKDGTMIKLGGCTECSKQCGFKGGCDLKI